MGLADQIRGAARRASKIIDAIKDDVLEDAAQMLDHPGYMLAGPFGPVLADLNRRGAFKGITKIARGVIPGGGLRPSRRSGGDHIKPKNTPVDTHNQEGYCSPSGRKARPRR